jgi:hypothetical protein
VSNEVKRETAFSKIISINDLIAYLDDHSSRLKNREYLYHYTTLNKAIDIFKGKLWHLGNAKYMNDQLEYSNGDKDRWKNIFFASFMTDVKENIGMWSMYSQPWEDGVLLMIPKGEVQNWIKNVDEIFEISCKDYKPTGKSVKISATNNLFLSSVAYSNCDNPETDENKKITWSTVENIAIKNATQIPELTGYIKNSAWDYEREIRIKATLEDGHGFQRTAIKTPRNMLDSIEIVAGPLFKGELNKRLHEKIENINKISNSLFHNKLFIKNTCSDCPLTRKVAAK